MNSPTIGTIFLTPAFAKFFFAIFKVSGHPSKVYNVAFGLGEDKYSVLIPREVPSSTVVLGLKYSLILEINSPNFLFLEEFFAISLIFLLLALLI